MITILLLLYFNPFFCCELMERNNVDNIGSYKPLPDSIRNKTTIELINSIKPLKCKYWQCIYVNEVLHIGEKGNVVVYFGDSTKYKQIADKYSSTNYFLPACHPGVCGYYVVAVMDSEKVQVYDNDNIREFIGTIDNLEEIVLSVNLHGYRFSEDTITRGAFIEHESYYTLYLTELGYSPNCSSIKAILNKTGDFKIINREILQSNDSIRDIP